MKILFGGMAAAVLTCAIAAPSFGQAAPNPSIVVDENGNGSLTFAGGAKFPTKGVLKNDPGPGGLNNVMTYDLLGPPNLVAGDVKMTDSGSLQDVVRFNPAGTGAPGYPASLLFYSDNIDGFDALADTPSPPGQFYTNVVTVSEVTLRPGVEGAIYTPGPGQPGFVQGFNVQYTLLSDVPEPATWAMLILGLAMVGAGLRRARAEGFAAA